MDMLDTSMNAPLVTRSNETSDTFFWNKATMLRTSPNTMGPMKTEIYLQWIQDVLDSEVLYDKKFTLQHKINLSGSMGQL